MSKKKTDTKPREVEKHEWSRHSLMRLSREELNEVAIGLNINPKRAANKGVLADSILLEQNDGLLDGNKVTPKQEMFCTLYASDREFFGNGTQSYIEAFDVDVSTPGGYASARAAASALLTNINILTRIDELMEATVLNDTYVDKTMGFWIQQRANPMASIAAIKEYNKVHKRTVDAMAGIGALVQNNYQVSIHDEQGKAILAKHTEFMLEITKSTPTPETLSRLRNAKDYQPVK